MSAPEIPQGHGRGDGGMKTRAKCGTQAGYVSHYYHREKPCEACQAAQAAYKRAWDERRRAKA